MLEQLQEAYGDDMQFVYRHFPLTGIHDKATLSSLAAEAAGKQGAFWEFHDLLFERQQSWSGFSPEQAKEMFANFAAELGLDRDQFLSDMDDPALQQKVDDAETAAADAGLRGTPTVFINGYEFPSQDLPLNKDGVDFFLRIVRLLKMQYDSPEQVIESGKQYQATIETEKGDIVIDLFPDTAPINTNSFAFLAEQGWYDDTTFHRVLPDFMAQGGDPLGLGIGWPGYRCTDEVVDSRKFDKAGVVAMANSGPNSNSAQFFITYGPAEHLNNDFTIIGQVVSGQDVVDALTPRDPEAQPNFDGDKILKVTISEK